MAKPVKFARDRIATSGLRRGLWESSLIPAGSAAIGLASGLMNESVISGVGAAIAVWAACGIGQSIQRNRALNG